MKWLHDAYRLPYLAFDQHEDYKDEGVIYQPANVRSSTDFQANWHLEGIRQRKKVKGSK